MVDDSSTKEFLTRLVRRITSNTSLRDDLLQEAMVHLWLMEGHRPGQTRSWYLQSCKFHLQHYLASGRSVDSRKRSNGQVMFAFEDDGHGEWTNQFEADNSFMAHVSAREIISELSKKLRPREKAVLHCLADGLGARDIAKRLKISHPTAIKHRRRIAALAIRMGISIHPSGRNGSPASNKIVNRPNGRALPHGSNGTNLHNTVPLNGALQQSEPLRQVA